MTDTTNPKHAAGSAKLPVHLWPNIATAYGSIGMLEGETKYGRNNFIATPVVASIYIAAAMRHLMAWQEGEEFTKEGGPHLGNALATIAIILKARNQGTLIDDREYTRIEGAFHAEFDKLTKIGNDMRAWLQKDMADHGKPEPKHYDRRDINKPKPGAVVELPKGTTIQDYAREQARRSDPHT